MRFIAIFLTLALLSGCNASTIRGKEKTVEYSQSWIHSPKELMYCGSDKQSHHFTARPVDSFVFFVIGRQELLIVDERPYTGDDLNFYYAVDPSRGFEKVPNK